MADYYAILKKALGALPNNTGEARREVYEKARRALLAQLKSVDPPLSASEITKQRLALEESIRKVESEAARASLGVGRPQPAASGTASAAPRPSATPQAPAPRPAPAAPPQPAKPAAATVTAKPLSERPTATSTASRLERPAAAPKKGVEEFRQAVADASTLGGATSEASRAARQVLKAAEDDERRPAERREPDFSAPAAREEPAERDAGSFRAPREATVGEDIGPVEPLYKEPMSSRTMWLVAAAVLAVVFIGVAAWLYSQWDLLFGSEQMADTPPAISDTSDTTEQDTAADENGLTPKNTDRLPSAGGEDSVAPDARAVRTMRVVAPTANGGEGTDDAAAPAEEEPQVINGGEPASDANGQDPPQADDAGSDQRSSAEPAESAAEETQTAEAPASATPAASSSASEGGVAVGQRAILYEEAAEAGGGNQAYSGNVTWQLAEEPANAGSGTDTVLVARADIPDRNIAINIKIRPNRDPQLPASYWIEVGFELPDNFAGKGIANVPGLILKNTEAARGDALRGASARVLDNLFWIALSENDIERARNKKLLLERGWIDIPVLYESDRRAILTLEKGNPGERLLKEAFDKWETS